MWADENGILPAYRLNSKRLYPLVEAQPGVVAKRGTANTPIFWNVVRVHEMPVEAMTEPADPVHAQAEVDAVRAAKTGARSGKRKK